MDRRSDHFTAHYVDAVLSILHDDEDADGIIIVLLDFGLSAAMVSRIAATSKNRRELTRLQPRNPTQQIRPFHQLGHA